MRTAERMTERVTERTTERMTESTEDLKILSCLNRLEKDMSAILQALKKRKKKRKETQSDIKYFLIEEDETRN